MRTDINLARQQGLKSAKFTIVILIQTNRFFDGKQSIKRLGRFLIVGIVSFSLTGLFCFIGITYNAVKAELERRARKKSKSEKEKEIQPFEAA